MLFSDISKVGHDRKFSQLILDINTTSFIMLIEFLLFLFNYLETTVYQQQINIFQHK